MRKYLLSDVDMGDEEAEAVAEVVRSKWLSLGPRTAAFEDQFRALMGAEHAVALSSCTAAVHLALQAFGVGRGDEVIVPSYTFVASVNPILYLGAKPVFVEIGGERDLNLDTADLERKITPRTKAIVVVHMAGFPADMDRIMAIAEAHDLKVVEDACHAIGSRYAGLVNSPYADAMAGTMGHAGCFSFFANKNLVTGEGGMLVTHDEEIATKVRFARSHGMTKSSWDKASGRANGYDVASLGYNYRGTELMAALGSIQLRKLLAANARRKALVAGYRERLSGIPGLTIPFAERLDDSAHHIFPVLVDDPEGREPLRKTLESKGVQTSVHYPPVHTFTHYRSAEIEGEPVDLPLTENLAAREVTLPLHPLLTEEDVANICQSVTESLSVAAY